MGGATGGRKRTGHPLRFRVRRATTRATRAGQATGAGREGSVADLGERRMCAPVPTRGEIDRGRWRAYPSNGRHPRRSRRAGAPGRAEDDAAGTRACGPPGGPRAGLTSAGGAGRRPTREWILWETTRKDVDDRDHDGSSFRGNSRLRSHRKVPDPGARNATRTRRVAHPFSSHVPKPDRARTRGRRPGVTGRHSGVILVES